MADLPLEEAEVVQGPIEEAGLGMVLFVAPTSTDERLARVAAAGPICIYAIADLGVTGERRDVGGRAIELAERVRSITDLPLIMGVGISTPEQAGALRGRADGVIVGSALVRRVLEASDPSAAAQAVRAAVSELADALR